MSQNTLIINFFVRHGHQLRAEEDVHKAFIRLAQRQNWRKQTKQNKRDELCDIILGGLRCDNNLLSLQDYCVRYFPSKETPSTITACKKLLNTIYVNIWVFMN
jgi:hypothetical protein